MERGIRKRQAALADAEAEAGDWRTGRLASASLSLCPRCHSCAVEVKEWTGKLAVLEEEEAELLKSLQARQEIQRQKRAAVVKEAGGRGQKSISWLRAGPSALHEATA